MKKYSAIFNLFLVFSQYKIRERPESDFFISENQGFWREFGFGMISIFKSDLQRAGGYDLTIEGWGMEDVRLIEALIAAGIDIFR